MAQNYRHVLMAVKKREEGEGNGREGKETGRKGTSRYYD